MAVDVITTSQTLTLANGDVNAQGTVSGLKFDQTGTGRFANTQAASTTPAALNLGSLTTPGWCQMRNISSSNNIQIGPSASSAGALEPFIELAPGEVATFKLSVVPFFQAVAGTPELDYIIFEA